MKSSIPTVEDKSDEVAIIIEDDVSDEDIDSYGRR